MNFKNFISFQSDRNTANKKLKNDNDSRKMSDHSGGDEWTEISLNASSVEDETVENMYQKNEATNSDEEEQQQIPYKPFPTDTSVDSIIRVEKAENHKRKLVSQTSLPVMSESRATESAANPSLKYKTKLDSSLSTWISRSSAVSEATGSQSGIFYYFVYKMTKLRATFKLLLYNTKNKQTKK